jgi:hypothetical protein
VNIQLAVPDEAKAQRPSVDRRLSDRPADV